MGQSLAKINDVPSLKATQRESLIAFLNGVDRTVDRLVSVFTEDISRLPEEARVVGQRILVRADTLRANIADELSRLSDSSQGGDAWWTDRVSNGRYIVGCTEELSSDMVGFLQTGEIPSEARHRREMYAFVGVAAAIAATGAYLWWRTEKNAEAEIQAKIDSGELEDCGCTAPS